MSQVPPWLRSHTRSVPSAIALVLALSATAVIAQFGTFNPAFDGELWGVRHELTIADDGVPAGVAFSGGRLFIADSAHHTVIVYDSHGQAVAMPGADWDTTDPLSPVFALVPHQLAAVVVDVNGVDRNALLVSDSKSNRAAAFDTADGSYLFTLRLERPSAAPTYSLSIGQMAMSTGGRFHLTTSPPSLTLSGSFAAAWREQLLTGAVNSGALAFVGASSVFPFAGGEFAATATSIVDGTEGNPVAPAPLNVFGVTFDTDGNLYALDAYNELLHVYSPALTRLFTFGTPVAGGGTAEFNEPWGLAFWPDAAGTSGRILINDTYNSRIMIYRPVDGADPGAVIDGLDFASSIANFVAPNPPIELFSLAVDPSTNTIAVSDFAELTENAVPRVVVLQKPRLATFNLQLLDEDDEIISSVCADATFKVRFSLTVPPGLAAVDDVTPTLLIDGVPSPVAPVPAAIYPSATLSAGEVMTFTYSLPGIAADVDIVAGATASNTNDVSSRAATIFVARCADETDATTFALAPNIPAQVSGWTPVHENESYSVAVHGQDDDGIEVVEYELTGANLTPGVITTPFEDVPTDAEVVVPIPDPGRTTLRYRARDGNGIWSAWQAIEVRTRPVIDRVTNENAPEAFRVGDPEGIGFVFSVNRVPDGVTFSSVTGQFSGTPSYNAHDPYSADPVVASGIYHVVITETAPGGATSEVGFTWTINHINRAPSITPVVGFSVNQDEPFTLQIVGSDPDGDPAFWTIDGIGVHTGQDLPPGVQITIDGGLIFGTFPPGADTEYQISVGLSECAVADPDPPCGGKLLLPGAHLATLSTMTFGVNDLNAPAEVNNPGPQSNAENDTVSLQIEADDAEHDSLTYSAIGLPPGLSIDAATGLISGVVGWNAAGAYGVRVEVDDHMNPPAAVQFSWDIVNTNRPPVVSIPDRTDIESTTIVPGTTISGFASDPDGSPVTFVSAVGLPPGVAMGVNGTLSGALDFTSAGIYAVTVRVSDGAAFTDDSFVWTVLNKNREPQMTVLDRSNGEGDVVSYQLPASDPDSDPLVFSINGLPPGLTLNTSTGLITGTLASNSTGVYTVNVGVSDAIAEGSLAIFRTFTWTIVNNRAPVCSAATGGEIWPPNHKKFYLAPISGVYDPDGNPITIAVTAIQQDEQIDSTGDGQFAPDGRIENGQAWIRAERNGHGNKAAGNGRVYEIFFTATDTRAGQCSGSVLWTVPHDQGQRATAIDDGIRYDSTGVIPGAIDKKQKTSKK